MPHDTPLITTIVAALVLAYVFGAIANRLKMPPIVGYLIAGVLVGPHSPGFVADQTLASQLAEIGVILLMFGVGLNFSLRDLMSVRAVAVPGALIRLAAATAMGWGLGVLLGWPMLGGIVFGLAVGVSSTVVTLKALQDRHLVDSDRGHMAMGWLIVEDLAMVLALVLIPAVAGAMGAGPAGGEAHGAGAGQNDALVALAEQLLHRPLDLWMVLGLTVVKLAAFVGFMVVVGRRIIPFILHATAHTGSRELFRLAVLAVALGVAAGAAYFFGVSLALGAFFAGMILSESELSHRAAQETLPLRDAFGVLFFVSVGMLFDPSIVLVNPLAVFATLGIVLFGKSIIGFVLLLLFRRPPAAALQVSAALAQVGEFSFILAALGVGLGVLPEQGQGLILFAAIVSIILNPLAFWLAERLRPRLESRPLRHAEPDLSLGPVVPDSVDQVPAVEGHEEEAFEEAVQPTRLSNHVVLIGYGRVGSVVAAELSEEGVPFLVIEDAEGRVNAARAAGAEVIVGNAATHDVLMLANVMGARSVVIAIPNAFEAGQAVEQCRRLNANVRIIARAHADEEIDYLKKLGADEVIMGEREIGLGMVDWLHESGIGRGAPKLSTAGNLLRQAREERGITTTPAVRPGAPMVLEPLETDPKSPPAAANPAAETAEGWRGPRLEPIFPGARPLKPAPRPIDDGEDAPASPAAPAPAPVATPTGDDPADEPASDALSGAGGQREPEAMDQGPEAALALLAGGPISRNAAPPRPAFAADRVETAAAAVVEVPVEPAVAADLPPVEEPQAAAVPEPAEAVAVVTSEPEPPEQTTVVADAPAPPAPERPHLHLVEPEPEPEPEPFVAPAPEPAIRDDEPALAAAAAEPQGLDGEPARAASAEAGSMGEAPSEGSDGSFRVVSAAEIDILPPASNAEAADEAVPRFKSEFWAEPTEGHGGAAGPEPDLIDVQQAAAARARLEEGSWLEALERDLFGTLGGEPDVTPAGAGGAEPPEPRATPTRERAGESAPSAVPPVEVAPADEPRATQTAGTRAEPEADESVDAYGRREPRL
jgi:CPA2 family monovalent cation:H+ antiporter-2